MAGFKNLPLLCLLTLPSMLIKSSRCDHLSFVTNKALDFGLLLLLVIVVHLVLRRVYPSAIQLRWFDLKHHLYFVC